MNSYSDHKGKLILETVDHVVQLKNKLNQLNIDTSESDKSISLVLEESSDKLDDQVKRDLSKIDN